MSKLFSSSAGSRGGADADGAKVFCGASRHLKQMRLSTSFLAFDQNRGFPIKRGGIYLARL